MKPFKRVARRIGSSNDTQDAEEEGSDLTKRSVRPRRIFHNDADDSDEDVSPVIRKPSGKQSIRQNLTSRLPTRPGIGHDAPSYSSKDLADLRDSQTHAPANTAADETRDLDIEAKFGSRNRLRQETRPISTHYIPTDAEIQEKKERRRRLRQEQDYISLGDNDDMELDANDYSDDEFKDRRQQTLIVQADEIDRLDSHRHTRLVAEDEDIAEGFEQYVEDAGRVALSRKAAKEQEKARKRDIEEQIREAQAGFGALDADGLPAIRDNEDDLDLEEVTRIKAYESAQMKSGSYQLKSSKQSERDAEEARRRSIYDTPVPGPLPQLSNLVARLKRKAEQVQAAIDRHEQHRLAVLQDIQDDEAEESRIEGILAEAQQKLESLERAPAASGGATNSPAAQRKDTGSLDLTSGSSLRVSPEVGHVPSTGGNLNTNHRVGFGGMSSIPADEDDYY